MIDGLSSCGLPRLLMVMPYRQLVEKAKERGFWVGSIWDETAESPEYLEEVQRLSDVFVLTNFRDRDGLRRTIRAVAQQHHTPVVYHIGQEDTMVVAYEVAEELHAELNPRAAVRLLVDKHAMRVLLAERGLSPVSFELAPTRMEVPGAARRIGYPVVVKPTTAAGSRGVLLWHGPEDHTAWTGLVDQYGYEGPFLVEEYLRGPEYSVETLTWQGRHQVVGITQKLLGPPPLFVEVGHIHPAPLSVDRRLSIDMLTTQFLTACGYQFGPAHTEVIWTRRGPRIVESQARLGGDRIPRLVLLATGLDIERAIFALMAGQKTEVPEARRTAMVRFFTFPSGRVDEVRGLEAVRSRAYVDELKMQLHPGETAPPTRDSKSRHGHVIISADSPEEAWSRCKDVLNIVVAVIDGVPTRPDGQLRPGAERQGT